MSSSAKRPAAPSVPTAPSAVVRITLGVILAIIVAMVACTQVSQSTGAAAGPAAAEVLPADFPIPADAEVVSQGISDPGAGVVTLDVPGSAEEVVAFYAETLPSSGWITEPWEGTDPYGKHTQGLILRKDGDEGALSVTGGGDGRARVDINLNQPVTPTAAGAGPSGGS